MLDIKSALDDLDLALGANATADRLRILMADPWQFRAIKNVLFEIGEAVRALPEDVRVWHPDVDWKGYVGMRNIVAHQ
jgi:uncharacterized protein with HEPN domain